MLHADKRALEQNLKVNLLRIREKELHFYTENCVAIGTQASLLAGFAYAGLIQVDIPDHVNETLKTAYLCVTTTAMGLELVAVLNSTLCSMLGPGLALRGPDGSMHKAVDEMMEEYRLTFFFFGIGLVAFHFSALLFAWLEFIWCARAALTAFDRGGWLGGGSCADASPCNLRGAAFGAQAGCHGHVCDHLPLPVRHVPLFPAHLRALQGAATDDDHRPLRHRHARV